ncbi:hypothetical protein ACN42_g11179 [Penicillium freii]|uniref:Uncharacterized protein n=1 Tax=Penicillium freii TaxID=48697 RepID=A0A117NKG5_PENFR|nr:hypothetical protein ACN42_g11179 [Penicillium freii]
MVNNEIKEAAHSNHTQHRAGSLNKKSEKTFEEAHDRNNKGSSTSITDVAFSALTPLLFGLCMQYILVTDQSTGFLQVDFKQSGWNLRILVSGAPKRMHMYLW